MDRLFEILMTLCLDAAMLVFVLSLARSGGKSVAHARLISITMSVGFLLGAAAHCIDGVNAALLST